MFNRAPEEDEGDQNMPEGELEDEDEEFGFKRESEVSEGDQNF